MSESQAEYIDLMKNIAEVIKINPTLIHDVQNKIHLYEKENEIVKLKIKNRALISSLENALNEVI